MSTEIRKNVAKASMSDGKYGHLNFERCIKHLSYREDMWG